MRTYSDSTACVLGDGWIVSRWSRTRMLALKEPLAMPGLHESPPRQHGPPAGRGTGFHVRKPQCAQSSYPGRRGRCGRAQAEGVVRKEASR